MLWARAAGRCSHPECRRALVVGVKGESEPANLGEAAHIIGASASGPRGKHPSSGSLDSYDNLILLCAHHHNVVDKLSCAYSVDELHTWKAEHEAWVAAVTAPTPDAVPWAVILQDPFQRSDLDDARRALGTGGFPGETLQLEGNAPNGNWQKAAERELRALDTFIARTPPHERRFAVFPIGPIPLAVHLGYVLGDRARVSLYHYDRDRATWAWDRAVPVPPAPELRVDAESHAPEANLRVSLSASIARQDIRTVGMDLEIAVPDPSVRWLRHPIQLHQLSQLYAQALAAVRARKCRRLHLYYAGPAAGAVAFGRAFNPLMNPPLELYQYSHNAIPCYQWALELTRPR
jgi:hypothetical protein